MLIEDLQLQERRLQTAPLKEKGVRPGRIVILGVVLAWPVEMALSSTPLALARTNESSWDEGTRGGGVGTTSDRPVPVIAVENLLRYGTNVYPYEDILVHEFAHGVLNMGLERHSGSEEYRRRLESAYEYAMTAGLWAGIYAGEDSDEYWAEGVQTWLHLNDPSGSIHNVVNTRAELEEYDPALAGLVRQVFGD